jgi:RNA-directed DNA polymerase
MSRTVGGLHERLCTAENLREALRGAARGKHRRPDVAAYMLHAESSLAGLAEDLRAETWRPGGYHVRVLTRPKARLIACAPFSDRVIHHALHRVIEPVLSRRFMPESFACRPGLGTHRAVLAFERGLRRHRYVLRLDIRRYFLEVDWDILAGLVAAPIRDRAIHRLVEVILESGRGLYADPGVQAALGVAGVYNAAPRKGLPIGNLTSQLFANVYLDGLDHLAKRTLGVPTYVRYMDDVALFGDDPRTLAGWAQSATGWLAESRRLTVHPGAVPVSSRQAFRFLGHHVDRSGHRVAGATVRRLIGRLRRQVRGGVGADALDRLEREFAAMVRGLVW